MSKRDTALTVLLRDFDYEFRAGAVWKIPSDRYASPVRVFACRSVFHAAELVRPIIGDKEFSERHERITSEQQ